MPPACGTSRRTSSVGTAAIWRSLLVCRIARLRAAVPISATLACACVGGDAGLEPALDEHPAQAAPFERACLPTGDGTDVVDAGRLDFLDVLRSAATAPGSSSGTTPVNDAGATPTIVYAWPRKRERLADDRADRCRTRAATSDARSPPRARAPGSSSDGTSSRPSSGCTPSIVK